MNQTNEVSIFSQNSIITAADTEAMREFRLKCQTFVETINRVPDPKSVDKTFDGKAFTILISHIETTLDEFFFGLWDTVDFRWQVIANEVVGSIQLEAIHPVTGHKIKRTGAAAIEIQVDAVPSDIKTKKQRNEWALDPSNKKAGALDMGFPKLKAECIKNAANSLGKMFGRDLNRGGKADTFKGLISKDAPVDLDNLAALFELKRELMASENITHAERIINNKEVNSYSKLFKELQAL